MLRVRINWTGLNSGYSVMHFLEPDDQTGAQAAADAADDFLQGVDNFYVLAQFGQVDPEVLVVDPGTNTTTGSFTVTTAPRQGSGSGDAVPNAAQILVRWRTGVYVEGREIRGRTFIPGAAESSNDSSGNVASTTVSAINSAAATLISSSEVAVYSPTHLEVHEASAASTWPEFAILRSRRD